VYRRILSWVGSNRLQLDADKIELIWCAISRWLRQIPATSIRVGYEAITPSSVRDLSVYFDADSSMRTYVHRTVASCFVVLRQIRSIRRSLLPTALQMLVVCYVLSRRDYGNTALVGIPAHLLRRLQYVQNAAARSIAGLARSANISISLAGLHWLRAAEHVKFEMAKG
jgi:hypothetical protein